MTFDANTRRFTGSPPKIEFNNIYEIWVKATDPFNSSVEDFVTIDLKTIIPLYVGLSLKGKFIQIESKQKNDIQVNVTAPTNIELLFNKNK